MSEQARPIHCDCCEGRSFEYVEGRAIGYLPCPGLPDYAVLVSRLVTALEPFAENPVNMTDYPCHKGLVTAEKCGRCSRAAEAYHALAAIPPDLRKPVTP